MPTKARKADVRGQELTQISPVVAEHQLQLCSDRMLNTCQMDQMGHLRHSFFFFSVTLASEKYKVIVNAWLLSSMVVQCWGYGKAININRAIQGSGKQKEEMLPATIWKLSWFLVIDLVSHHTAGFGSSGFLRGCSVRRLSHHLTKMVLLLAF